MSVCFKILHAKQRAMLRLREPVLSSKKKSLDRTK